MNSLHNTGETAALAAIKTAATKIRLYTGASVPAKNGIEGAAFIEVANGNGYTTGGQTIASGDWTSATIGGTVRITLKDITWSAVGGNISDVAGAYIVNSGGAVLAWWERTPETALNGGTVKATGLYIG